VLVASASKRGSRLRPRAVQDMRRARRQVHVVQWGAPVRALTSHHVVTGRIRSSLRYERADAAHARRGCTFVGNFYEARRHAADAKQLSRFDDDGSAIVLIETGRKRTTSAAVQQPPTEATLFWDFDNVSPWFLKVTVPTFFLQGPEGVPARDLRRSHPGRLGVSGGL
jgi:hypothetical protein